MSTTQREYYAGLERASAACAGTHGPNRARAVHATVHATTTQQAACHSGCDHCCHFPVGVRLAEAMLLAEAIRGAGLCGRVTEEQAQTASQSWGELAGRRCPLLVDGRCAVYEARPTPCRALLSADAQACAQALSTPTRVPRDEAAWWRGLGAASLLDGAFGARELRSALAAVLAHREDEEPRRVAASFAAARRVPGQDD